MFAHIFRQRRFAFDANGSPVTVGDHTLNQTIPAYPLYRVLARRINVSYRDNVSVVETATEIFEQAFKPCEPVRLMDRDQLTVAGRSRRFQNGGNFNGVVTVVIDNCSAVPLADPREATFDASKPFQRGADIRLSDS